MGLTVRPNSQGKYQAILEDEPDYIVALPMAPAKMEEDLCKGRWVVVNFSIWSVKDRESTHRAMNIAKEHGGSFRLGLRPVDYLEEVDCWTQIGAPNQFNDQVELIVKIDDSRREVLIRGQSNATPVWVAIRDGQIARMLSGPLRENELEQFIKEVFPDRQE